MISALDCAKIDVHIVERQIKRLTDEIREMETKLVYYEQELVKAQERVSELEMQGDHSPPTTIS